MKKILLLMLLLPMLSSAQPGYINKIAGSDTSGFSGDGGPAVLARMGQALGVHPDIFGNVYVADDDNGRVRKVSPSGIITTVAGGGNLTTDGIPATSASINLHVTGAVTTDVSGNLYLVDGNRIRKVDVNTGIITTVAGTTTAGYSGDGGPATAAQLNYPHGICIDAAGNLYIGDENNHKVRKVNTSGIISTYAGTGNSGFNGDGGPATAADMDSPDGLCMDAAGNLYVADRYNYRIRKINSSGIITTYAGSGMSGFAGDGGPALAARFSEPSNVCVDGFGNLYIADFHNGRVRKVDQSGIVTTYAGGGASMNDGVPATSESFSDVWGIGIDQENNIYIPDRNRNRVCKVTGIPSVPTASSDSFSVYVTSTCSGPYITIIPSNYSASLSIKTWFGDGLSQTDTFSAYSGSAVVSHAYALSGIYTIKHVLYDGNMPIDSVSSTYNYVLCRTMALQFYYDGNSNCVKDNSDIALSQPILIEVDSNNVPVDTLSSTSGIYYTAYGADDDVYGFKVISTPNGFYTSCPMSGIVYDTLGPLTIPTKSIGVECNTSNSFDLSVNATIPVTGVHDQWGNIYVQNNYCQPMNATLTLHYSPKYAGVPDQINPPAASVLGNSITWNLNALSSTDPGPLHLHYSVWSGATYLTIGDTVQSYFEITPTTGDSNATNNAIIIYDTVKAGCDPNEMWVNPECIVSAINPVQLTYTVNFENTGNDTAHNIYILDTLPANVDVSTMRLVMNSHTMYTSKTKDAAGHNILKFDFPSINLLDSSHHGECDGGLVFTIDTRPGLPTGTQIKNRAGIYFDVNDVVMTNEVNNVIGCFPALVNNTSLSSGVPLIHPNPARDIVAITADVQNFDSYDITNSMGQTVLSGTLVQQQTNVDLKDLPSGIYFLNIKGKQGNFTRKLVKL